MKKYSILLAGLLAGFTSCSKYLDVQEDFSASDSLRFVLSDNGGQVRRFHGYIYNALTNSSHYYGGGIDGGMANPWVCLSDDMVAYLNGNLKTVPTAGYLSNNAPHHRWDILYKVIRVANLYLANAKTVGKAGESDAINEEEMNNLKAEAYVMRAYAHYLLFELYGPIPVMSDKITEQSNLSETFERNSVDEVVDAIVKDIDTALTLNLTETHILSSGDFDNIRIVRPTKGVALAIKAKALVLAASPLYNGGFEEGKALANQDGKKLFPSTADPNKWVKAKEALEALFQYANQGNYELYKSANNDPHLNVYELFQKYNKEIIWANASDNWATVEAYQTPRDIQVPAGNSNNGTLGVTQEMVDAFFMANGLKINDPNSGYTEQGTTSVQNPATAHIVKGVTYYVTDPNISNMYANREPRFYASVLYQGRSWHDVVSNTKLQATASTPARATRVYFSKDISSSPVDNSLNYREKSSSNNTIGGYPLTGYLSYKFNNRTVHPTLPRANRSVYRPSIIFRLADFYLLYAEVLNEINPADGKIVEYLDKVRERAGIPGYRQLETSGKKTGIIGNQAKMREAIQHERRVELFAEGQRYFDVRRWLIADKEEGRQGGLFTGMNMEGNESDRTFYQRVKYNVLPRIFERKMYLYPIPYNEIQNNKGKLVQNPGW